jgi:hypothetical protein
MAFSDCQQSCILNQFSGMDGQPFSPWFQKFEDFIGASFNRPLTLNEKINQLKVFLSDYARERIDDLTREDKSSWKNVRIRLTAIFDDPQLSAVARAKLSAIKQKTDEPVLVFSQRLKTAVKAACAGETTATYQSQLLNYFMDKLQRKIGFFVKTTRPANFLTALNQALHYESICEAEADNESIPPSYQINSNTVGDNSVDVKELKEKVDQLQEMVSVLLRQTNEPRQGPSRRYDDRSYDADNGPRTSNSYYR